MILLRSLDSSFAVTGRLRSWRRCRSKRPAPAQLFSPPEQNTPPRCAPPRPPPQSSPPTSSQRRSARRSRARIQSSTSPACSEYFFLHTAHPPEFIPLRSLLPARSPATTFRLALTVS